jgi:hypothetical protein
MSGRQPVGKIIADSLSQHDENKRLHLQLLTPTNPHWACVLAYGL